MADSQSARWSSIIMAVRQQLIDVIGLSNTLIRIVASTEYNISYPDSQFIVIAYSGLQPDTDIGIGRSARPAYRNIKVFIYSWSQTDMTDDDLHALTDDGAHGDFEESVLNALDQFTPLSGDSPLTIEPLHIIDSSSEGVPHRDPENDKDGVIRTELSFQIRYIPPNNYTVPTATTPNIIYPE